MNEPEWWFNKKAEFQSVGKAQKDPYSNLIHYRLKTEQQFWDLLFFTLLSLSTFCLPENILQLLH